MVRDNPLGAEQREKRKGRQSERGERKKGVLRDKAGVSTAWVAWDGGMGKILGDTP
jgi:hypothetical protein